jgi:hypothetical protein
MQVEKKYKAVVQYEFVIYIYHSKRKKIHPLEDLLAIKTI